MVRRPVLPRVSYLRVMHTTTREPAPLNYFKRIQLGDVGYVRRGCFHLLFSAGCPLDERQLGVDVPLTFRPLTVGPIINNQPRLPGYLSANAVCKAGVDLGASICAAPCVYSLPNVSSADSEIHPRMLEPGSNISVTQCCVQIHHWQAGE